MDGGEALLRVNIPYTMVSGDKFYSRKSATLFLISISSPIPSDNISYERVINEPKRGVGPGTVEKIRDLRLVRGNVFTGCVGQYPAVASQG